MINVGAWVNDKDLNVERGIIDYKHAAELLTQLYEDETFRKKVADDCYNVTQNPQYRWEAVAEGFAKAMEVLK